MIIRLTRIEIRVYYDVTRVCRDVVLKQKLVV